MQVKGFFNKQRLTEIFRNQRGLLLTIVLAFLLLCFYFGHLLKDTGNTFFSANGDGIKNYYTAAWHYEHDSSVLTFNGLNYPYGDHIMFADAHFPLVTLLKAWTYVTGLEVNVVFWINFILLFSFILSALFIYKIFREFHTADLYAAIVAVGITFMSPIINRMGGHYSLAWSFIIPLIVWLFIRWYKSRKILILILTALVVSFAALLHIYFIAIAAGFICGMWAILIITEWKRTTLFAALLHIGVSVVVPVLLLGMVMKLGPQVGDRTTIPYGFYYYSCLWEGVLLPPDIRNIDFLQNYFRAPEWEGTAPAGTIGSLFFLFSFNVFAFIPFIDAVYLLRTMALVIGIGVLVFVFVKKGKRLLWLSDHPLLNAMLWTAFGALILSFAWPFKLDLSLYNHLGPIKQFRGIGRLAWVFFYLINIAAFVHISKVKWPPLFRYGFMAIALIVLFRDADRISNGYIREIGTKEYNWSNMDPVKMLIQQSDMPLSQKYSSIIPVPAFHVGSEVIGINPTNFHLANSLIASWETGLPLASDMMGRTSVGQTLTSVELMMTPYRMPSIINLFPPEKKVLLLRSKAAPPDAGGSVLINAAKLMQENDSIAIYEIAPEDMRNAWSAYIDSVKNIKGDSILPIIYRTFDANKQDPGYFTPGSLRYEYISEPVLVMDDKLNSPLDSATWYELSMWASNLLFQGSCYYYIEITFYDATDSLLNYNYIPLTYLINQVDGEWQRIEFVFKPKSDIYRVKVAMLKSPVGAYRLWFDNIMLKPCGVNVVEEYKDYRMINNRFFPTINE